MSQNVTSDELSVPSIDLTDQDIYNAMKSIQGYLDITPGDFKELYCLAYRHAVERITRSVLARDIMAKDVVSVRLDTPLTEVAEIMGARGISGVPVIDHAEKVAGMISEKDFLVRMGSGGPRNFMTVISDCLKAQGCIVLPIRENKAADIMTSPAIKAGEDTSLMGIAQLLTEHSINRIPIVDSEDRLLGIVTRTDIVRATHTKACGTYHF